MKTLYLSFADPKKWRACAKDNTTKEMWRAIRSKILTRDNYTCQYCEFQTDHWQIVHHIDSDPNNNHETNLETVCPICNLIMHSGQGCEIQGLVDLYEKSEFSQNEIIKMTRDMRAAGKTDDEIIEKLGLKGEAGFRMDRQYLKGLFGFVSSRKANDRWTSKALAYGHLVTRKRMLDKQNCNEYWR